MIYYLIIGVLFLTCYQSDIQAMKTEETPDAESSAGSSAGQKKEAKKPEEHIYRRWANLDGCPNAVPRTAIIKGIFDRNAQRLTTPGCESFFCRIITAGKEKTQEYWDAVVKTDFPAVCLNDNGNFIGYGLLEIEDKIVHVNAIMVDTPYAGRGFELELLQDIFEKYPGKEINLRTPRDYDAGLIQKLFRKMEREKAKQQAS